MSLEAKLVTQLNQHVMKLSDSFKQRTDPLQKVGLHPVMWKISQDLDAGRRVIAEIRRVALKKRIEKDFRRQNDELKVFCKCFGSVQP